MTLQSVTDEELLARYRAATSAPEGRILLDELFRRLITPVALCCYRCTGDYEWAADLAQEVLMQAFRSLASFRGDAKISTWVHAIARNHCFKAIRAQLEAGTRAAGLALEWASAAQDDPYAQVEREDSAEALRAFLRETLTELEIRVITLRYGEELSLDQITEILGLRNSSGAKAYLVSAKRKLQAALKSYKTKARLG